MKNHQKTTSSLFNFENLATVISTGFGLYCIVWMVMVVRPEPPVAASLPATAISAQPEASGRMMPNSTEREFTKLCSARTMLNSRKTNLPAASWTGVWQGDLGKAIRTGGLLLDWTCFVQEVSPTAGLRCSTRGNGGIEYSLLPLHALGELSSFATGTRLDLRKMRQGLAEKQGVVVDIDENCGIRVVVDSNRFISDASQSFK